MSKCTLSADTPNDPEWVTRTGIQGEVVAVHPAMLQPQIGTGGYKCNGCDDGSVCIALFAGQIHSEIRITPEVAREVAADLMVAIARADPRGAN